MVRPRQIEDEELLAVACTCFIEHGPSCPTSLIAQEAGVSQATLFKRFGTKQQLLRQALRPKPSPALLARLAAGPDDAPIPDQLRGLVGELVGMFERLLPCVMTLWAAGENPTTMLKGGGPPPPVQARRSLAAWFAQAESEGRVRPGDPDARALVLIGAAKELTFQKNMFPEAGPHPSPEAYADALVETLWAGCAPAPEAP